MSQNIENWLIAASGCIGIGSVVYLIVRGVCAIRQARRQGRKEAAEAEEALAIEQYERHITISTLLDEVDAANARLQASLDRHLRMKAVMPKPGQRDVSRPAGARRAR